MGLLKPMNTGNTIPGDRPIHTHSRCRRPLHPRPVSSLCLAIVPCTSAMAQAKKGGGGVPALGWWLMAVGTVRLPFAWPCFFGSASLCSATYSQAQVSDVHGRTVGVWTLLSCTLCFLCAFNLGSRPIYAATFLSLVYAYGHFVVESLVYHTGLGFFAVTAMVWMLLQWNSHAPRAANKQP
ncbi:hypothetical protein SEVIR_9G141500v4 [Setaria viridis]|uniref:Ergosterol biosynthetic protein 28 n=1 Tax=Setaria viridis TaxID=4556 RepID=A0A4U6STX3_SETVI|nr:ergosterol biosynthetic protein 28-like [Setaria viridis]TKV92100.1 hypothetical protein SEVIR_9G141500v2 [Setaria viridis]